MTRRILSFFLIIEVLFCLSGCGRKDTSDNLPGLPDTFGSAPEEDSTLEAQPTLQPGSFTMPFNNAYGWDPYNCNSMENRAVLQLIYEGLFCMDNTFDPVPVLCKNFTVSEDGKTYTIELQDASFSNGDFLTADDVIYSFNMAQESELFQARFKDISYYEATGGKTISIYLRHANDRLPCLLDFPIVQDNATTTLSPAGTGPFIRASNDTLTKNNSWWQDASTLQISSVSLLPSLSAEDTRDNFEVEAVQFVYNDPMAGTSATYHCDYELWDSPGTVMQYIGFNCDSPIFSDYRARAAVSKAIDRAQIAESVYHNFAVPAVLPVSPASSMYSTELAENFDFAQSDALDELLSATTFTLPEDSPLRRGETDAAAPITVTTGVNLAQESETITVDGVSEAVDPNAGGFAYNSITMLVMSGNLYRIDAAKMAAQYLSQVGFTVEVHILSQNEFYFYLTNTTYDLYYADISLTPDFDISDLLEYNEDLNYSHMDQNATLEALFDYSRENSGNRYDLYKYIMEQGYLCPILFENNAVYTTRGVFTGLNPSPDHLFFEIEKIHVN